LRNQLYADRDIWQACTFPRTRIGGSVRKALGAAPLTAFSSQGAGGAVLIGGEGRITPMALQAGPCGCAATPYRIACIAALFRQAETGALLFAGKADGLRPAGNTRGNIPSPSASWASWATGLLCPQNENNRWGKPEMCLSGAESWRRIRPNLRRKQALCGRHLILSLARVAAARRASTLASRLISGTRQQPESGSSKLFPAQPRSALRSARGAKTAA
jgi:hypothetical protein